MRLEFARLAAAFSVLTLTATAGAQIPSPTIEGPITGPGNPFVASTGFDLAQVGYEEAEYFINGTASAMPRRFQFHAIESAQKHSPRLR